MAELKSDAVLDPARDSAQLLRRVGFFTLGVAFPVAAMVSRRATVVLVPIGVAVLVIAAILIEPDRFTRSLKRRASKVTALALGLMLLWSALSLAWAPSGSMAVDRIYNMLFALVIGILGVAALPDRMRATNLNALAVGSAMATIVAVVMQTSGLALGDNEEDVTLLVRGLALVVIMAGPLVAWLLLRGRTKGAIALFGTVAIACLLVREAVLVASLMAAIVSFAIVAIRRGAMPAVFAGLCAAVVLAAPLAPTLARMLADSVMLADGTLLASLQSWGNVITAAPVKLITGHGFGSIAGGIARNPGLEDLPTSVIVIIWHELGIVGALAFAAAIWFAMRAVPVLTPVMQAGAIAAYVAALTCGVLGLAEFRAWWLMTLVAIAIMVSAIARGQARTDRPMARLAGRVASPAHPVTRPSIPTQS